MAKRRKRETSLQNLVTNFEMMKTNGTVTFNEERSYHDLIEFFQTETQYQKAIEVVDYALTQFQFRSDFYFIKSKILFEQRSYQESLDFIEMAENISPYEVDIQLFKSKVLTIIGMSDQALQIITSLEKTASQQDLAEVYISESYIHESSHDFDQMFQSLKRSLLIDASNSVALERIWQSVELSKNFEECIFLHKLIIDEFPYNSPAWFNLGHAYSSVGEYQFAIDALEYSFIINPEFEDGYLDCADLCFQLKKYEQAKSIYGEAVEKFGKDPDTLLNLAQCQFKLNDINGAKSSLIHALSLDPYYDEAQYLIANCYLIEENITPAIKALKKAIYLDDSREEYYHSLARCYVHLADFDKAKRNYFKAAVRGTEQSLYWEEYIAFLIKLQEYNPAMKVVDEAEKFTYSDKLMYCKSAISFKLMDYTSGLDQLEEAITENADNLKFFYDLVPELRENEDIQAAIRYFLG